MGELTTHTPTPWEVFGHGRLLVIAPEPGWTVFEILDSHPTERPIHEANAAFIVKAVNAHDALVSALLMSRAVHQDMAENYESSTTEHGLATTAINTIDAALAKAGTPNVR